MDSVSVIRDDSGDAVITLEAGGRIFTILLCEDPRMVEGTPGEEAARLGAQIYGLLDHYCNWTPSNRKALAALQCKEIANSLAALKSNDVAAGSEFSGGRDVFDVGGSGDSMVSAAPT
jgi:hypothetical protein